MNGLQQLINQLCPNGVEMANIGDVAYISDYVSAGSFASIRENVTYKNEPDYAILLRVADFSSAFDESKFIYIDEHAYNFLSKSNLQPGDIIMSNVGSCGLTFRCPNLNKKMSLAPNAIVIRTSNNSYFYHWFTSNKGQSDIKRITSKSAMPKFNKTQFKQLQIPLPPLAIQSRIVEILDHFTNLTANLTAELALRRKQFEHFREKLLSLDGVEGVEMKTLGEVCKKVTSGGTPNTKNPNYYNGDIPWLRTQEVDFADITDTGVKITNEGLENSSAKWIPSNCVIVAMYGATVGKVAINKIPLTTNQACCNLEINEDIALYKFVYYCIENQYNYIKSLGQGCQTNINAQIVKQLQIPVPPLAVQQSIVAKLDKFTALILNIENELALRQKQYEYYREKLLSFPSPSL